MDWVGKPQNYKNLYGILQLLRGSHLHNFQLKCVKRGWVTFHSITFQLKYLDFQSNQYKKLVPVLFRFCNCLFLAIITQTTFFTPYLPHSPPPSKKNQPQINKVRPLKKNLAYPLLHPGNNPVIGFCWRDYMYMGVLRKLLFHYGLPVMKI